MATQLRHDLARSLALFAVIVVAASSFALLSGASETSRLQSTNTVATAFRPAYDLLVRPHGAQGSNQGGGALVPPDSLASQYGGISMDQWKSVLGVPGVEVAAPVAMVGYGMTNLSVPVDVSGYLPAGGRQVLRLEATWVADHGLTTAPAPRRYFYSTSQPLDALPAEPGIAPNSGAIEKLPNGSGRQVCMVPTVINRGPSGTGTPRSELLKCWSGTGSAATGSAQWVYGWIYPYLIAAIDPVQEAKLAGLDRAVITGRYLDEGDAPSAVPAEAGGAPGYAEVPVLVARNPQVDQDLEVAISRLDSEAAEQVLTTPGRDDLLNAWQNASGTPVGTQTLPGDVAYKELVKSLTEDGRTSSRRLFEYYTVGPVTYSADDQGTLTPKTVGAGASAAWSPNSKDVIEGTVGKPAVADDTAFRSLTAHRSRQQDDTHQLGSAVFKVIGQYDRTQLPTWNELSRVSMDMYYSPTVQGADQRSRDLVGEDGLLPSANIGGLLTAPATMLTTLDALSTLQDPKRYTGLEDAARAAPISVVRVRLSGNLGIDDVSRERIRLVAQEITRRTGLDVDIMVGSSPSAVTVAAPAGKLGRPDLALSQDWARKGVATIIISAIDKKSLAIFLLILVVAALAVGNATAAAVRTRRTELAVLACTGWRQSALVKLILAETAVVGLLGSVAGVALAVPVAAVEGIAINPWWMVATVPCALAMVLGAAAVPALRAGRADPGAAVRPAVSQPRRGWPSRTVASTALSYLLRLPGRTLIGAASLAVGVAALAILLVVTVAFHGAVAGSLLGEAVSVEARLADYLGVGIIVILGAFSVADVLYLNVRDTRGELAALAASGWTDTTLARLVIYQGLGIGLLGAALGVAGGVMAASLLVGETTLVMAGVSGLVGVVGVAVTVAAAVLPLLTLRRLPLAEVLSEG